MMNIHFLPVRLESDDVQRLQALCVLAGVTRGEYLRILVRDALGKQEALMNSLSDTSVKLKALMATGNEQDRCATYKASGTAGLGR